MAEPTSFSNEYAADMLEDPWQLVDHTDTWLDDIGAKELRPAEGRRQYVNKMKPGTAILNEISNGLTSFLM